MFEIGMIAVCIGIVAYIVASIWFYVVAFRQSIAWGLGVLLLPFVSIAFFFVHLARAWRPGLTSVVALIMIGGGAFATSQDPELDAKVAKTYAKVDERVDFSQYEGMAEAPWLSGVTNQFAMAKTELSTPVDLDVEMEEPVPYVPPVPQISDEELIGLTQDEVLVKLGKPSGTGKGREGMFWMYSNFMLSFADDYIVSDVTREDLSVLSSSPIEQPLAPMPMTPPARAQPARPPIVVVSNGGQKVNLADYVGKGKVTIVDFYADWCGPCKKVDPSLRQLAQGDHEVELVKINIVKWGTPVTIQHNITSVPNMMVFDAKGKQVGKAVPDFRTLRRYIIQAKSS